MSQSCLLTKLHKAMMNRLTTRLKSFCTRSKLFTKISKISKVCNANVLRKAKAAMRSKYSK